MVAQAMAASQLASADIASSHRWFMTGQACWFLGSGINMVLYPWLVAVVLRESPEWVGITQMATMAPSLVLMIPGGMLADRFDQKRMLILFQILATLPALGLIATLQSGGLTTGMIILFAALSGSALAFVVPTRDALLTRTTKPPLQTAVIQAMLTQFAAMLAGIMLAGLATFVGAVPILAVYVVGNLAAAFSVGRLAPVAIEQPDKDISNSLAAALSVAFASPVIRPVLIAIFAVGVCYVGSFLVVLPLQVRDIYDGGAGRIALVNVFFWLGTIVATASLLRLGPRRHPGRVYVAFVAAGVIILGLIGTDGPFWWLCLLCFIWGIGAGASMSMARGMVQEAAPPAMRARILALYNLGFMGGAPIGAVIIGYLIKFQGPKDAVYVPAAAMVFVVLYLVFGTRLLRLTLHDEPAP
jgi:MFS family permease